MSYFLAHQQNALEKGNGKNDKNQFPQANEIQSYAETTDGSDDEFHDCEGEDDLEEEDPVQINEKPIPTQSNPVSHLQCINLEYRPVKRILQSDMHMRQHVTSYVVM